MIQIALNESTAAQRRIPLPRCVSDADGVTELTGLTFSAAEIKISKNGAAEASSGGTVGEIGNGYYYYDPTSGEVNTRGFFQVRLNKAGVRIDRTLSQIGAELNNVTALMANIIESNLTVRQALAANFSTGTSKSDGAGTGTVHYRNKADTLNRVTATITSSNRSAVSYDFSDLT